MNRRDFLKNGILLASLSPFARLLAAPADKKASGISFDPGKISRKRFRNTALALPMLGFGTMRIPRGAGDAVDKALWQRMVDKAMEAGLNHFDTAWFYVGGKSENLVAEALQKYPRSSYTLADKLPVRSIKTLADAERIFEEQLKKCRTGYFDFYLLHALNRRHWETVKKLDLIAFVEKKRKEGKIKNIGFSFHDSPDILQQIVNAYKWDFVLLQINYLDWVGYRSKEQYEIASKAGIPVMVMEPLKGGRLANPPERVTRILKAQHPDSTPAQWAFRFAASLPNVLTVLSGMSAMAHLEENIRTFTPLKPLSDHEKRTLDVAARVYRKSGIIPCTGCNYCLPCPVDVNIPKNFSIYNDYKAGGSADQAEDAFDALPDDEAFTSCVNCGACLGKCPQKINIPEEFKKMSKELNIS